MSLTIISKPPELILSQQPVVFVLGSNAEDIPLRISGGLAGEVGDSVQADGDKKATFELSDYLQGLITERYKTADTPTVYANVPKQISFEFCEYTGEPPVKSIDTLPSTHLLLDGRIPKRMRRAFYAANTNLLAYLKSSKSCLTWWPDGEYKKVLPGQKEFLNYLQVKAVGPLTLYLGLTIHYTDGASDEEQEDWFTIPNIEYLSMVYIPVGPAQLDIFRYASYRIDTTPGLKVKGYSVRIWDENDYILKEYFYELDQSNYDHPRQLWVRNPFGMLETINCTGIGQQDNKYSMETLTTDGCVLPDKISFRTTREAVVKCNTGHLTAKQMLWLSDLFDVEDYESLEAYEMIGNILTPIVFREINLPLVHDGEYQFSGELEYEYADIKIAEKA